MFDVKESYASLLYSYDKLCNKLWMMIESDWYYDKLKDKPFLLH